MILTNSGRSLNSGTSTCENKLRADYFGLLLDLFFIGHSPCYFCQKFTKSSRCTYRVVSFSSLHTSHLKQCFAFHPEQCVLNSVENLYGFFMGIFRRTLVRKGAYYPFLPNEC